MGVFKQQYTKPTPANAEIVTVKGQRVARWRDARNKLHTAPVSEDGQRITRQSKVYYARYQDGNGVWQTASTACTDKQAAEAKLSEWRREAERIRAGLLTAAEAAAVEHQGTPLQDHFGAYLAHLEAAGCSAAHRANVQRQLERIAEECRFSRLNDLDRHTVERWLAQQTEAGMSARTRNSYLTAAAAFANWCADPDIRRLLRNPFEGIGKLNEKADQRRKRRAMAEAEMIQLLRVARERPLLEALTVRKGPRKGERYANVRDDVRQRLELIGQERALIYKTLVLTGLRKGELASLAVAQLSLEGPSPFAELDAADEKSGEGNTLPLRADLAEDLREWLAGKLRRLQEEARLRGQAVPRQLPPETKVFDVPDKLSKILNRDLKAAGIPKRDERGRVLDVHALRHTYGDVAEQRRRVAADGPGGHAAQQDRLDHERLHGPAFDGCRRRPRHPAAAAPERVG
jgi:integrase